MKKLISMVIVISLMCSATMAFANGIETEEETVNCEIIEEQHNIDAVSYTHLTLPTIA